MKNQIKNIVVLVGTILFVAIFWQTPIGVNALIFSLFIIATSAVFFPKSLKSTNSLFVYSGVLLNSLSITYHASGLAIFVWIVSLFLLQAVVQTPKFRTLFFSGTYGLLDYFSFFVNYKDNIKTESKFFVKLKKFFRIIKFVVIPLIAVWIFYWLYKLAVPEFDKLTNSVFGKITHWLNTFFENFSFGFILMIFWGLATMIWFVFRKKDNFILPLEQKFSDKIVKKRKSEFLNIFYPKGLKPLLKFEFIIALILIISVNTLLLIVNFLDITTIWFGFEYTTDIDLKQFVHSGTYILILSILLSMAIMLFYFRNNLNFYAKNKALKISAYIWISQNLILLISVIIRNLHYIEHFALAYLRIGLFFFLAMVTIGLFTLFWKIYKQKSIFYLLKSNSWVLYVGFVLFAMPDWDSFIAKYNINHYPQAFVEASFMLALDEKTLPIINQKELLEQDKSRNTYKYFNQPYQEVYNQKVNEFVEEYPKRKTLSWNYADYKTFTELSKK